MAVAVPADIGLCDLRTANGHVAVVAGHTVDWYIQRIVRSTGWQLYSAGRARSGNMVSVA